MFPDVLLAVVPGTLLVLVVVVVIGGVAAAVALWLLVDMENTTTEEKYSIRRKGSLFDFYGDDQYSRYIIKYIIKLPLKYFAIIESQYI